MGLYTDTHTEYINNSGKEVPSVTTVLKIINKPALQLWANGLGFRHIKIKDELEKSASMGTLLHNALEAYQSNKKSFKPNYNFPDEEIKLYRFLNNYLNWAKDHRIEPISLEQSLTCESFGGTLDFYGKIDGKYTILDYKTSKNVYSSMFLQLGAYCYMLELEGKEVEQVAILNINNKIIYTVKTREELQKYIDIFLLLSKFFNEWYDLNIKDKWGKII